MGLTLRPSIQKALTGLFALTFFLAAFSEALPSIANAVGQITTRSITMSTSAASTAATYTLTFTPVTTAQELIVDFCSNDPLVTDTCSFSAATVPTIASPVANHGTAASVGSGSPVHTIKVTGLTMTGGSAYTISFTSGVTNPTSATSFYARVLTYGTGNASGYVPANTTGGAVTTGTYVDYGGAALSTVSNVNITSKVFETLSFCVFSGSCGTAPTLILGDPTTGALSITNAYVNSNAQYTIATNAASGALVTMTGTTLCRSTGSNCQPGGTYAANTIAAIGATPVISAVGTSQFGMCVDVTGSTSLSVASTYTDSANNCHGLTTGVYAGTSKFGFDDSTSTGTNSGGCSTIVSSSGPVPNYTGTFAYLGNVSPTTPAGIYTTSLNLVATGTF
jgi:hypothetical protein